MPVMPPPITEMVFIKILKMSMRLDYPRAIAWISPLCLGPERFAHTIDGKTLAPSVYLADEKNP